MATTSRGRFGFRARPLTPVPADVPFDGASTRMKAPVWRLSEYAPAGRGWFARHRARLVSGRAVQLMRAALRRTRGQADR